jgi:di/tricarboxylate transporter
VAAATSILTAESLRIVDRNLLLLLAVLSRMGGVFAATGLDSLDRRLAQGLAGDGPATGLAPVVFVMGLTLTCIALSLALRVQASVPLLTVALAPVAVAMHADPWIVAIVALVAGNGFILAYQNSGYIALVTASGGKLFRQHQARPVAIAYFVCTLLGLATSLPLWHLMSLL